MHAGPPTQHFMVGGWVEPGAKATHNILKQIETFFVSSQVGGWV
jgi:hypothetical protein